MKKISTLILNISSLILLLALSPALAAFGNGSSFKDAAESTVNYAYAPARPVLDCSQLFESSDANVSIVAANLIKETADVPEHCLVYGVISPEIQFVVQLPSKWNKRLFIHGNGGDGGESVRDYYGLTVRNAALRNGFVTSFNNMGHDAQSFRGSTWAYNNLQRELDFSYRALHLNAIVVKEMIMRYYGREVSYSYFDGCSTGGGQGLKAAQRFPGDFDGIVAGAPVSDPIKLLLYFWHNQKAQELMQLDDDRLEMLGKIIMDRYDGIDGLKDGIISNPAAIDFDPQSDLPRDSSGKNGFTDREIAGLSLAYGGLHHKGKKITPGIPVGAELAGLKYEDHSFIPTTSSSPWHERVLPNEQGLVISQLIMQGWFRYVLFDLDDPEFDWRTLDLERDLPRLEARAPLLAGRVSDLSPFKKRGGKLILYNGWGDVGVNPFFIKDYYDEVLQVNGDDSENFARLFLVPGMFHCLGGYNADRFDGITAVINWVEAGISPDSIIASRMKGKKVKRTRPLCPYPKVASYRGKGNTNKAENFQCR